MINNTTMPVGFKFLSFKQCTVLASLVYILVLCTVTTAGRAQSMAGNGNFLLLNVHDLQTLTDRYKNHDAATVKQVDQLLSAADSLLKKGPWSVTYQKTRLAPSGNKHDYVSQAPYWWPDSSKADGKPYIRKDGRRNPEIYLLHDAAQMDSMATATKKLALAWHLTHKQQYADRAAQLLKTWFIDAETRMNPNLNYAQYVPGVNDGRGIGIIETIRLLQLPDAVTLLSQGGLDKKVVAGVKDWFGQYVDWMRTSKNGREEVKEKNNHGTNYDLQLVVYSLFTGEGKLAADHIKQVTFARIPVQLMADGQQPLELARTRSWDYSQMNLLAWCRLAFIAKQLQIDLWHQTTNGRGIEKALAYLIPYAAGEKPWDHQEIGQYEYGNLVRMVRMARGEYKGFDLKAFDQKFPEDNLISFLL